VPHGFSAEIIAGKWELTRDELDEYAYLSHQRVIKCTDEGYFKWQIIPFTLADRVTVTEDEGLRRDTSVKHVSQLTASFHADSGVVTAGNSSQISDGASGLLLMSKTKANELGVKPRARIISRIEVGYDPVEMLTGVIPATKLILKKAGLSLEEMDAIE